LRRYLPSGTAVEALSSRPSDHESNSMKRRRVDNPPVDERNLRLEQKVRKLRTVLLGTATLNSALNYERVMDLALDLATSALADSDSSAGGLVSALLMYDGETLQLVSSRGFLHADQNAVIPGRSGVVEQAMSSGQLEVTNDPAGVTPRATRNWGGSWPCGAAALRSASRWWLVWRFTGSCCSGTRGRRS